MRARGWGAAVLVLFVAVLCRDALGQTGTEPTGVVASLGELSRSGLTALRPWADQPAKDADRTPTVNSL